MLHRRCWYWGGFTGYDVSLGPLPGETITKLGPCSDFMLDEEEERENEVVYYLDEDDEVDSDEW